LDKRDLFKEGAIALEPLSETTNFDSDSVVIGDVASLVSAQGGNPYRIQMKVPVDLQRFCWLVEDGFETSLIQWSDSTVFSIEPHAVADTKPMKRLLRFASRLSSWRW
jgi:hypothetical protein